MSMAAVQCRVRPSAVLVVHEDGRGEEDVPPADIALLKAARVVVSDRLWADGVREHARKFLVLPVLPPQTNADAETLLRHHRRTIDARDVLALLQSSVAHFFNDSWSRAANEWPALRVSLAREIAASRRIAPEVSEAIDASDRFPLWSELIEVSKHCGAQAQLAAWRAIEADETRAERRRKRSKAAIAAGAAPLLLSSKFIPPQAIEPAAAPAPELSAPAAAVPYCERLAAAVETLEALALRFAQFTEEPEWMIGGASIARLQRRLVIAVNRLGFVVEWQPDQLTDVVGRPTNDDD